MLFLVAPTKKFLKKNDIRVKKHVHASPELALYWMVSPNLVSCVFDLTSQSEAGLVWFGSFDQSQSISQFVPDQWETSASVG